MLSLPGPETAAPKWPPKRAAAGRTRGVRVRGQGRRIDAYDDSVALLQSFDDFGVLAVTDADLHLDGFEDWLCPVPIFHHINRANERSFPRRATGSVRSGHPSPHLRAFFGRHILPISSTIRATAGPSA